jgi:iron(III) transport system ATP-binding protein
MVAFSQTAAEPEPQSINVTPLALALHSVSKRFGSQVLAVDAVSLAVPPGEFVALLGPSGCGKSTTLRLLAGLEYPDSGEIWLADRCVAGARAWIPPEDRRVGLVFQDYALFPHLNVGDNVAFALHRQPRSQRQPRIDELLELVGLAGLGRRYPHQLSGGQQQRVALARALAADPAVVLLDEPFSNLDTALRSSTREEVRTILKRAGTTALLVTHDQEEALSLADTVAVMFAGGLVQVASPPTVYLRPISRAVATFVGAASFVPGEARGDIVHCALGDLPLAVPARGAVEVLLRPEAIRLQADTQGNAQVSEVRFFGSYQRVHLRLADGTRLTAQLPAQNALARDTAVAVTVQGPVMAYSS